MCRPRQHQGHWLFAHGHVCPVSSLAGLVLTCGRDSELKVVDMRTFEVRASMRAPGFCVDTVWSSAALSPDERYVTAGSSSGSIYVWEVSTLLHCPVLSLRSVTVVFLEMYRLQRILDFKWGQWPAPWVICQHLY